MKHIITGCINYVTNSHVSDLLHYPQLVNILWNKNTGEESSEAAVGRW